MAKRDSTSTSNPVQGELFESKVCEYCGAIYFRPGNYGPAMWRRQRFCSPSCWNRHRTRPLAERFWEKVVRGEPDECWLYTGGRTQSGHGHIKNGAGVMTYAHRVAWELTNGPIPDGLRCLHRCDNPPCCNPAHLFLGTQADNVHDMIAKGRDSRGEQHPTAKLTEADVRAIKELLETGRSLNSLGRQFGVDHGTIRLIKLGRNWRHVK